MGNLLAIFSYVDLREEKQMPDELAQGQIIEGRSCDGCTLCCKLLSVEEIDKPQQHWCEHCDPK